MFRAVFVGAEHLCPVSDQHTVVYLLQYAVLTLLFWKTHYILMYLCGRRYRAGLYFTDNLAHRLYFLTISRYVSINELFQLLMQCFSNTDYQQYYACPMSAMCPLLLFFDSEAQYMIILFMVFIVQFSVSSACLAVNREQQVRALVSPQSAEQHK